MNDIHDQIEPSPQLAGNGGDWRTDWTPNRRRFISLTGLALGGAVIGLSASACGTAQTGSSAGQEGSKGRPGAAGETLFIAGFQWNPPKTFNPFAASPDWPTSVQAGNQSQFIYETLVRFNLLDGSLSPGLAKEL
jgi:peptide/nickel transport system substrate-binding protein